MAYELHCYNDEKLEFEYTSTNIKDSNVLLELYRGKVFCFIIKEFINLATNIFGTKIFSIKKSFPRTLTNLLSSWMFTLYASENFDPEVDPFLPNNYTEIDSLVHILNDLVKYDTKLENINELIQKLTTSLIKLFVDQHKLLNNYKKSNFYHESQHKFSISKKKLEQVREENKYDFYKFYIKIDFEIKDKRLSNILDNLLIPLDEYKKLEKNYTGKKNKFDEFIWIILFRYQLLGSNNHQLGVKNEIMTNMNKNYNLNFECFASSINSTFSKYCSIYYDVERYFGSVGSFYNLVPKKGTFGVNPPYQKDIIETALSKLVTCLEDAETNKNKLTFIITIPIWDKEGKKEFNNDLPQQNIDYGDFEIIKKIKDTKFHKITRMISKEHFTYIDHNFKLLKNKTIQNTYVIILSSDDNLDTSYLLAYDFS
jgi:hypothetical protein